MQFSSLTLVLDAKWGLNKKSNCCKCARRDSNQGLLYKANQVMLLKYKVLSKWGTILDALRFRLCIFFANFPKLFEHLIILLSVRNSLGRNLLEWPLLRFLVAKFLLE